MAAEPKTVAVLRVFDIQAEDGTERRYDAHAIAGALQLEPGSYELVLHPAHGVTLAPAPTADSFDGITGRPYAAGVAEAPAAFYLATHDEVTPTEGNEPRVLKHAHVESYLAAGWRVRPALVAVCPECECAHGVPGTYEPSSKGGA